MKKKTIVKFIKNDEGISIKILSTQTVDVLVGIAETIQLISKITETNIDSIMSDINKILEILEENKEENENE